MSASAGNNLKQLASLCRSLISNVLHAEVFAGVGLSSRSSASVLNEETLKPIVELLSTVTKEDVGLATARVASNNRSVGYIRIYSDEILSVGIFVIPCSISIPLHDHPDMCVLSKVLYGSVQVESYDWDQCSVSPNTATKPLVNHGNIATKVFDGELKEGQLNTLYQNSGGNLHKFTANSKEGCAILDIIAPQYDENKRPCTYYKAMPLGTATSNKFCLESVEESEDFCITNWAYQGLDWGFDC